MELTKQEEAALTISPLAADKIKSIMAGETEPDLGLRVFVTGGGCSGLSYGMALDNNVMDDDVVFEQDGIKLITDQQTLTFIKGSEIDYVDQLMGGGFTLHNPNAVSTCACGSSFRTEGEGGTVQSCSHH